MNFRDMHLRLAPLPLSTTLWVVSIDFVGVACCSSVCALSASLAFEKLVPQTVSRIGRNPYYSWWLYCSSGWQGLRLRGSLDTQHKQHSWIYCRSYDQHHDLEAFQGLSHGLDRRRNKEHCRARHIRLILAAWPSGLWELGMTE